MLWIYVTANKGIALNLKSTFAEEYCKPTLKKGAPAVTVGIYSDPYGHVA